MFGVVHLRDRRLEPDVVIPALGETDGETGDRFHRERVRGHHRDLLRNRFVLTNWRAPLHTLVRPSARRLQQRLSATGCTRRKRETTCVERDQRELESLPF